MVISVCISCMLRNKRVTYREVDWLLWGAFAEFRKVTASSCLPVLPHGTTRPSLNAVLWSLLFGHFWKSVGKFQVSVKSNKNDGQLAWRPAYIYYNIAFNTSYNEKYFRQICGENKNNNFIWNDYFPKIMPFMRFFFWRNSRQWTRASSSTRFLDHTQRRITVGRTPLD
jgi:hypothetical protein